MTKKYFGKIVYFIKIKLNYIEKTPVKLVVFKMETYSENFAKLQIIQKFTNWQGLKSYEILQISTNPIYLFNYTISAEVYYKKYHKKIMYKISAENQSEAETIFTEIVQTWKRFHSMEIINIYQN